MSIITLITTTNPSLGAIQFDAKLEDTFEAQVDVAGYSIETGSQVADHRIIKPMKYSLVVAISDNPLRAYPTQFVGAAYNNVDSGLLNFGAGLAAGILNKEPSGRSSDVLNQLITLMVNSDPFDVNIGERILKNMVITNISRTKDATNENGLICNVQLQELPTLDTVASRDTQPSQKQLPSNDNAKSQAAKKQNKGELSPITVIVGSVLAIGVRALL